VRTCSVCNDPLSLKTTVMHNARTAPFFQGIPFQGTIIFRARGGMIRSFVDKDAELFFKKGKVNHRKGWAQVMNILKKIGHAGLRKEFN
jgi:hypothetical protein